MEHSNTASYYVRCIIHFVEFTGYLCIRFEKLPLLSPCELPPLVFLTPLYIVEENRRLWNKRDSPPFFFVTAATNYTFNIFNITLNSPSSFPFMLQFFIFRLSHVELVLKAGYLMMIWRFVQAAATLFKNNSYKKLYTFINWGNSDVRRMRISELC